MNGQLEKHLQNIEDLIQIDDKIVTYKWISKVLKVHTNTAKQLLYAFTKKPEVRGELLVTYIIAGEQQDDEGLIRLVKEKDLEEAKKAFHKVTSIHVYSIQKGTAVSGIDIYNADSSYKLTTEDYKFCSIHPEREIERRKMKVGTAPKIQEVTKSSSIEADQKKATSSSSRKSPEPLKLKAVSPNKEETDEKPTGPKKTSPKKTDKQKTVPAKVGNIGALFKKQAAKNKDNNSTTKAPVKDVDENNLVTEPQKLCEKPSKTNSETTAVKKSAPKKKRKKPEHSKDSTAKRRKRIQVASDSESSDEESDGNERFPSPEPEPDTPTVVESEEEEIIPSTPLEKGKKRIRKLVDRTFEDEEGYIITKKEFIFESCSDDDGGEPAMKKSEVATTVEDTKTNEKSLDEVSKIKPKEESPPAKPQKAQKEAGTKSKNKPGRPTSKAKPTGTNSPKKQAMITNFFNKQ